MKQAQSVSDFEQTIQSGSPVLVEFYQPWCPCCKAFFPTLEAYAQNPGSVEVMQVNGEEFPQIFEAAGIEGCPTVMVFVNGQPVSKEEGSMTIAELEQFLSEAVSR